MAQRGAKLSPTRRTIMEKERKQRLAARPEDDFANRVAALTDDKIYNVSNFTSLGRGALPLSRATAEKRGYYSIKEVPELYSDNRLTLELALKHLGKWNPKIERSVEAAFGAQRKTSPKKSVPKKVAVPEKKISPKKKSVAKKAEPEPVVEKKLKLSPKKESKLPASAYEIKVEGTKAKISPRRYNYQATDRGLMFQ